MRFYADLHIHSKYSRACSKDGDIEHLTWWARRKGITLVGTGDFTHPAWFEHLRDVLEPAEPGLFRLRSDLDTDVSRTLPPSCAGQVRFMLSVEISTIYKAGERTRKVHHLCYVPDFAAAERFTSKLAAIGNLASDGRPILGLDSRDLLEITLESGDGSYLVPAHIWTPWFAALGSKAGFDAIEDCYRDLSEHIFALETGLSSDPEMNWRVSALDGYTLVSYSDAHSPPMLGREASVFDTDLDYFAVKTALTTGEGFRGTVEFFPEEGKYHLDGHRNCHVRFDPADTVARQGRCPACGKPLTVGVLNRVAALADRPAGLRPEHAAAFRSLIPLPEILGELRGVGPKSKKVFSEISELTHAYGPELGILDDVPVDDLARHDTLLGEAIGRLRAGQVRRDAGYDGCYGTIRLFEPAELSRLRSGSLALFDDALFAAPGNDADSAATPSDTAVDSGTDEQRAVPTVSERSGVADAGASPEQPASSAADGVLAELDADQRAAAAFDSGPMLIVAGPGTGKTRTVTHRLAHLVSERAVPAASCLAITFTRRAADEMRIRLHELLGASAEEMTVATFHSFGLRVLTEHPELAGLPTDFGIADTTRQHRIRVELTGDERRARRAAGELSRARRGEPVDEDTTRLLADYRAALRAAALVDFDELLDEAVRVLAENPEIAAAYRDRYPWITVDEYQDIDAVQYRLLRLLAPADGNLTAIGDPDQAIYSFRGADVGYFLRFQRDYPAARVYELGRNYRCGTHILTGALRAVAPSTLVPDRALQAAGSRPAHRIVRHRAPDEVTEAAYIARNIDALLGGSSFHSLDSGRVADDGHGGLGFGDIAVLYRTDAQAGALLDEFAHRGLPAQKRSHDPLSARAGMGLVLDELAHVAQRPGNVLDQLRAATAAIIERVPGETAAQVRNAAELLTPLARRSGDDLNEFRQQVMLGAEVDALDPRAEAVCLLTLHAAKGLEFPVVFIAGCEDGLLPLSWGREVDPDTAAEERRLMFVGMTRAHERLYLTHAARRGGRDRRRSPLLDMLGDTVTDSDSSSARRRQTTQLSLL